jgi:hypothetical protein
VKARLAVEAEAESELPMLDKLADDEALHEAAGTAMKEQGITVVALWICGFCGNANPGLGWSLSHPSDCINLTACPYHRSKLIHVLFSARCFFPFSLNPVIVLWSINDDLNYQTSVELCSSLIANH